MNLREYETLSKSQALEQFTESQWNEIRLYAIFLAKWANEYGVEDVHEVPAIVIYQAHIGTFGKGIPGPGRG